MGINWRERVFAATVHFFITLAVAGIAAAVIFLVWFPGAFATMIGGAKLFLMVIGIDLALGPLISLVIYSSQKSRRELIIDYTVVGIVQLVALLYGVFTVAVSRPVFVGFFVDTLEVVTAVELEDADLAQGTEPLFRSRSWIGPRLVAVVLPTNLAERNALVFSAVGGKDAHLMPKYYRPYEAAYKAIETKSQQLHTLRAVDAQKQKRINDAIKEVDVPESDLRWLRVRHRFGFGVALIDGRTKQPVKYVPVEPM